MKRMISMLLVLAMLFSMVPVGGWAEEATPEEETVAQEEGTEETTLPEETEETVPPEEPTEEPEASTDETEEETPPETTEEAPEPQIWEDWTYRLLDDGTVSLCGFHGTWDDTHKPFLVKVPAQIDHAPVAQIEAGVFAGNAQIEGVLLPETVLTVGDGAFESCTQLKVIGFLGNVPSLGDRFALGAENLREILVLEEADASGLTELLGQERGEGKVEVRRFGNQEALEAAFAASEDEGTAQGQEAFDAAKIIASGSCGESVNWKLDSAGLLTIYGSGEMEDYEWNDDGVEESYNYAPWHSNRNKIRKISIDGTVSTIGNSAFCDLGITNLSLPNGITRIGEHAFANCGELNCVTIPSSVCSIDYEAFIYCYSLADTIIPDNVVSIGDGAFCYCSSLVNMVVPNGVTSFGERVFSGCESLISVRIPDNVTKIGDSTFSGCSNIKNMIIPNGVVSIGDFAFNGCESLTNVTIPNGVVSIGYGAFESCSGLISITVPNSVNFIDRWAFYGCQNLISVTIPDGVTKIGEFSFARCSSLYNIVIPKSVSNIDEYAFEHCSGLVSITIPSSVNQIGFSAFYDCPALQDVYYAGSQYDWNKVVVNNKFGYNYNLLSANIHFNSTGPIYYVRYFSQWDAENKIAYFGPGDMLGSQVTAETDAAFAENPMAYLGQYVLVETKPNTENPMRPDILLSVKAVESKTGTVTAANSGSVTIDGVTYPKPAEMHEPESYVDKLVLYHIYNGVLAEVEALEKEEGILVSWDKESCLMGINIGGATEKPVYYTLSRLADGDADSFLNSIKQHELRIKFYVDSSLFVYSVESAIDRWSFANSSDNFKSFGMVNHGYYISDEDFAKLMNALPTEQEKLRTYFANRDYLVGKKWDKNPFRFNGKKWKGSCYGMSTWVVLNQKGVRTASDIDGNTQKLFDYRCSQDVESAINFYQFQTNLNCYSSESKKFLLEMTHQDQVEKLEMLGDQANRTGELFLISFAWGRYFKNDGNFDNAKDDAVLAHAVVGYGLEEISPRQFDDKTVNVKNVTFTKRILIYDCACPNQSGADCNIYYNDSGIWYIPYYHIISRNKDDSLDRQNNGVLQLVTKDNQVLNQVDYKTGLSILPEPITVLEVPAEAAFSVKFDGRTVNIMGNTVESSSDEEVCILIDPSYTGNGISGATTKKVLLPKAESYIISSEEPLNLVFRDENRYIMVCANASGTVTFGNEKVVQIKQDSPKEYYIDMVSNVGYGDLPWNKMEFAGNKATVISIEETEQGVFASSDNLENLTVRVSEGDNYTDTTISTKKDQILLTQDGQEPAIFEDSNGDGEFDRRLFDEDAIADAQVQIQQDYITMAVGSVATVVAQVTPDILLPYLQWSVTPIEGENVITVDQDGTIHAHNAGAAYAVASVTANGTTYTARCRVDVTEQKTSTEVQGVQLGTTGLTAELFRKDYASFDVVLLLEQNQSEIAAFAQSEEPGGVAVTGARFEEETVDELFELRVKDDRTLLVVPRQAALEASKDVKGSYSSKVCLQIGEETFVTDQSLKLTVKKSTPKLKAAALSFNAFYTDRSQPIEITGGTVTAVIRDENMDTAKTSALPDWLELEDGRLTLNELAPTKAASGDVYVQVETAEWANPVALKIPVKLTYGAPKLKLSATSVTFASANSRGVTLKLQCGNRADTLESLQVEDATAEGFDVTLDRDTGDLTLVPDGEMTAGNKELWVSFADTARQLCLKWKAVVKAPVLTANPKSVTLNGIAGDSVQIPITVSPADYQIRSIDYFLADSKGNTLERGLLNFSFENGTASIRTTEKTQPGSTYYLHIRIPEMPKDAVITVKTATQKQSAITVTAKASGSIDRSFPESAAVVTPTFRNYASGSFTLDSWTLREYEGKRLISEAPGNWNVSVRNGRILVKAEQTENLNAKHSYSLDAALLLENGQTVSFSNVKISVKHTPVKLKLSRTSLNLNPAVGDIGTVAITCQTKGYDFQAPQVVIIDDGPAPFNLQWENGVLMIGTNANTAFGKTYKLPIQANKGEPVVTLTIRTPATNKAAVSAKLTAKGSIDVVRDGTLVVVTPKFTNCASTEKLEPKLTVEWAKNGKGASYSAVPEGMFTVTENEDGTFTIQKAPGAAPDLSYQYRAVLSFRGGNPAYGKLTLKSGTGKVTAAGAPVLYKGDRFSRGIFQIISADGALNPVERVTIKDARQQALFCIYAYGNGEYAIGFRDNTVDHKAKYPTSITLNVFLEGNQSSKPNGTVTLKLAVR